jgi:hypothetical protein
MTVYTTQFQVESGGSVKRTPRLARITGPRVGGEESDACRSDVPQDGGGD